MPQLTEEDLNKIYPRAKTYDELEAARELRAEQARPKLVALKIALWTSLCIPAVVVPYFAALHVVATANTSSSMEVLAGVCFVVLLGIFSLFCLWYLRSHITTLASKVFVSTTLLYTILVAILAAAGGIGFILHTYEQELAVFTVVPILWTFAASFLATQALKSIS